MSPQPCVVVLAPMRSELRPVVRALGARPAVVGGVDVHRGQVRATSVVAALIGVGPDSARRSSERLLGAVAADLQDVSHVVVSGICGGIGPAMAVGDTIVPETVLDLAAGRSFRSSSCPGAPAAGTLATVDELILDQDRLAGLVQRGIVALDMETAAVAEVCESEGVAWSAFRVVSDRPQDGLLDEAVMSMLRADGSTDPMAALRHVLRHPGRVPALYRLGRDATSAASTAARAAVRAVADLAGR